MGKIVLIFIFAILVGSFFYFDGLTYLSLESMKARQTEFALFYEEHPVLVPSAYFIVYVLATALSLPGAALLTILAGALFGFIFGSLLSSFASSIGATLAFLSSRWLFRETVQRKFKDRLERINEGVRSEGAFYLFALRLVPAFPFFLINLLMGLTSMKTRTFFFVSQIGMLAGTMAFVNAGTQLSQIKTLKEILSPSIILSFVLLGLLPLFLKKGLQAFRRKAS